MDDPPITLFGFLRRLKEARIDYRMGSIRDDAILFVVALPGELWEIEFFANGDVEVERFRSDGGIRGPEVLAELFARYESGGE